MAEGNPPFIRNLASSDLKLRTSALSSLRTFLSARPLSRTDSLKLWSGLFYALWMCDRPIPQQNLASELADLLLVVPGAKEGAGLAVGVWLSAFWEVVGAKWTTIDVLRMEKFLLLVRRVTCASLKWAAEEGGDSGRVDVLTRAMGEWPLSTDVDRAALGLRLHVVDIWVDELERAGALGDDAGENAKKVVEGMGELVRGIMGDYPSKPLRTKAEESLRDERLPWYEEPEEEDGPDGWQGFGE
ncbi:related to RRP1 protein [Cephalotrichum gorgonifer]|uniref:Related to RRP1 protein n=1 Tax=Cephalotrichum gorgonifer TaxID=2041049 RepID=A0AAE8N0D2_9PEZI|nr:related to RRP1 protein [Cephalotrichum gorgonifer]